MTIEKCTIETSYEYLNEDEDSSYGSGTKQNYLVLKIPIPGGQVIFKYRITSDEVTSLEQASKLAGKER